MSGTMMPQRPQMPMAAPPQMPMGMPQGAPQQSMPQPGAQPGGPPQIIPPMVGGAAAQNPNLALFGRVAQGAAPTGGQPRLTPAEMGKLGRFGDQVVGHLTPGEIQVPPEVQSPKVLATLKQAFNKVGVTPQQFTAGSPQSAHNPMTGAPEYSLWASLLPVAGAVIGSIIPGIGTAAGMALGGAVGGAAGGLIDHQGALGTLLGAAGGAAGGYLGGSGGISGLLGSGASAASGAAGAAGAAVPAAASTAPFGAMAADLPSAGAGNATMAGAGALGSASSVGAPAMSLMQKIMGGLYAGTGAGIASSLAPQQTSSPSTAPQGPHLGPLNTNYGSMLGSNQANHPSFTNYSPYTSVVGPGAAGYRFFPVGG